MNHRSTSPDDPATGEPSDEVIVAYLDGELDARASRQLEERLAREPALRRRVQEFDRAWSLLDELPQTVPSEAFTQSTVEMAAIVAAGEVDHLRRQAFRRTALSWLLVGVTVAGAAVLGYFVVAEALDAPNRQLFRELPLIEAMDWYLHVDDVALLERLEAEQLFPDEQRTFDVNPDAAEAGRPVAARRIGAWDRAAMEQLSPGQLDALRDRRERFQRLSDGQRTQIVALHEALERHPQRDALRCVMIRYVEWLATLSAAERAALKELPISQRTERIRTYLERQEHERIRELVRTRLKNEDVQLVYRWLNDYIERNKGRLAALLPGQVQERLRNVRDVQSHRRMLLFALHQHGRGDAIAPEADDWERLQQQLSVEAQSLLNSVEDAEQRLLVLKGWVWAALFTRATPMVSDEALQEFFERLPPKDREQVERLPADQVREELRRRYFHWQMRSWEASGRRHARPGPPDLGRPPRGAADPPQRGPGDGPSRGPGDPSPRGGPGGPPRSGFGRPDEAAAAGRGPEAVPPAALPPPRLEAELPAPPAEN